MKTNIIPGSSADHPQTSTAEPPNHTPVYKFFSISSGSGLKKKLIGSLGALVLIAFAALSTREAKSDDNQEPEQKLPGPWNVTLRFPECSAVCPCPGGVPNIPIATLNTYEKDGTLLVANGSLFAGPGHGSWERIGHNHYKARFKFFIFNASGMRVASEIVTKEIHLTGPNTFDATSSFELFDAAGKMTAQGCVINETATRFE